MFSSVSVLHFKGHANRLNGLMEELKRVGVLDHPNFMLWESNMSAHDSSLAVIRYFAKRGKRGDRMLVLENDIRFLKDVGAVMEIMTAAAGLANDIVSLDPFIHLPCDEIQAAKSVPFMAMTPNILGASCYVMSHFAAQVLSLSYERWYSLPPDHPKFLCHQDLTGAYATRSACVQLCYEGAMNERFGKMCQHDTYRNQGIDYSLYAVPEGYGYGCFIDAAGEVVRRIP